MADYVFHGSELFLAAEAAVARLELRGDQPVLLAKLKDMVKLNSWHGAEQLKVKNLLAREAAL
ncbi:MULTISPECIES: hypothetical protein [unclassified Pseudomonas]|uniref:hypothetical protein n=1 Tax=unclassified Pseudomonas TaxID=196821 RepID=UPI003FA1A024